MYVVSLDGVMRNAVGAPIPEGVSLYRALCTTGRVIVCSGGSKGIADHWCKKHGFTFHDDSLGDETMLPGMSVLYRQVETLRTRQQIDLVVTSDPDSALEILDMGVAVSLFAHPRFSRPTERLDRARTKTWADITADLDRRSNLEVA